MSAAASDTAIPQGLAADIDDQTQMPVTAREAERAIEMAQFAALDDELGLPPGERDWRGLAITLDLETASLRRRSIVSVARHWPRPDDIPHSLSFR